MKCSCHTEGPGCIEIVPIFSGLAQDEMLEIAAITTDRKFDKGETIYFAGGQEKDLYVIHSGRVKISRISPSGKTQVIRSLGPGEFMGELAVFNGAPPTDYAEAVEPSNMCMIEGAKLKELMRRYPSIALKVMEELSSRLEHAENVIEDISLHPAEQRLAQSILRLAGEGSEFSLALTKGDFASQLGMTQETLSRKLSLFQDQGLIDLEGQRKIIIIDREGLAEI